MDNKEIYKKTIGFSLWRLMWDCIAALLFFAFAGAGFLVANGASNMGLVGLGIGAILGGIAAYIIVHFVAYTYKAGQIAMMTEGVVKNKLPADTVKEGRKIVKERFATVAAYYAVTGAIKGVFRQIGNGITAVGKAVGGDTGNAVGSTISSVINTIVAYLCDCCLGWVFYRKDTGAIKATLEGAVLFFRHWKTLFKNLGRVFGMSGLSYLVIAGVFTGIFYLITLAIPDAMNTLAAEIAEAAARSGKTLPDFMTNVTALSLVCSLIGGSILWAIIHSAFVRPFILVGVLRNYINSGIDDIPDEKSFSELDKKSAKFAKLHSEMEKA